MKDSPGHIKTHSGLHDKKMDSRASYGSEEVVSGFALLWGKILDSSIWIKESKETRLVWITMLAMKDQEGRVYSSVIGLADRAKVSQEECRKALKIFLSPDKDDTSKVEDGRRIREIRGGWEIINNDLYRYSSEEKREFWRQQKAAQRAKKAQIRAESSARKRPEKSFGVRTKTNGEVAVEKEMDEEEAARMDMRRPEPHGPGDNPGSEQINWEEMP
jgi:hypothetical protein